MDMADWRAGGHVTDAWSTRDPIGPRFDVNDSISRWSRARSVAPERIHHHHYHHHHHHHHARNRCSVAKEVVARVGVTTNCIVTRKLRDYGARGNHRECGACARREVARHRENGGRARKGVEAVRRQREDEEEGGGGRRLKQLLFILSDRIRGPSEWERESSNCSRHWIFIAPCSTLARCHFAYRVFEYNAPRVSNRRSILPIDRAQMPRLSLVTETTKRLPNTAAFRESVHISLLKRKILKRLASKREEGRLGQ